MLQDVGLMRHPGRVLHLEYHTSTQCKLSNSSQLLFPEIRVCPLANTFNPNLQIFKGQGCTSWWLITIVAKLPCVKMILCCVTVFKLCNGHWRQRFKPGMLKSEACMEIWVFGQSSCLKYWMLVGKTFGQERIFQWNDTTYQWTTCWPYFSPVQSCSLPVLHSSCTGVICECHSSLWAKQRPGSRNWPKPHQHHTKRLLSIYCSQT